MKPHIEEARDARCAGRDVCGIGAGGIERPSQCAELLYLAGERAARCFHLLGGGVCRRRTSWADAQ